jgi:cytoskeletal protein CcmA (bactofilin family)
VGAPSASGARARANPKKDFSRGDDDMANIGKSIAIKGDLTGNEDMMIEGTVEGKVNLPNNQLTIGANGKIRAEVTAKSVIVIGRVTGNVTGTERVEIQATGIVEGDVTSPKLLVAEGAVLNGAINMSKRDSSAARPPTQEEVRKTA